MKIFSFKYSFLFILLFQYAAANAQPVKKDTVKAGIYITSVHDIDFRQKEYTLDMWLWLKYKNKDLDFENNLEIPLAKSVTRSFLTIDSSNGKIYMLMKLQCVMKDSWKIGDFPFDNQKLRLAVENAQYDARTFVFSIDTLGKHYDPKFTLNDWIIDSCHLSTGVKAYETTFGDETISKPHTTYSTFRAVLSIRRDASGLFWKMFIGMYIAFLIAYICFYIHVDNIDSRFGLSVGSLFAVIGNKYIIDSSLPESTTFTLVDTLHGITLLFIFLIITATAYSLVLVKKEKIESSNRFDIIAAQITLCIYIILNVWFIWQASKAE